MADLEHKDFTDLMSDYRTLDDVLDQLSQVELIQKATVQQIHAVRKQLKAELERRGYSEEDIVEMSQEE